MAHSRIPLACYRLQFNGDFTFRGASAVLDYLSRLGITDIYASPLLQSRSGSKHGYDVTDPLRIDSELGNEGQFEAFQSMLQKKGMGLLLDIVPNHMAASPENPWWMDVLENGPASAYAAYFDIDWHPPSLTLDNKILLPVLGSFYGEALNKREFQLVFRRGTFLVEYYDMSFPLAPKTYRRILKHREHVLEKKLGADSTSFQEYLGIVAALAALPERGSLTIDAAGERRLQVAGIKERLRQLHETNREVQRFVRDNLRIFNGRRNHPGSFRSLDRLLSEQHYVLAYWQNVNEEINYRRFFKITDLVGVRVEDPMVFEAIHAVILHLIEKRVVTGLRIDHIDGLRDPLGYLRRLARTCRRTPGTGKQLLRDLWKKYSPELKSFPGNGRSQERRATNIERAQSSVCSSTRSARDRTRSIRFLGRELDLRRHVVSEEKTGHVHFALGRDEIPGASTQVLAQEIATRGTFREWNWHKL